MGTQKMYVWEGGRIVGRIEADKAGQQWLVKDRVFRSRKTRSRVPRGWLVFSLHLLMRVDGLRIIEMDGTTWECPLATARRTAEPADLKGRYGVVPDEVWTRVRVAERQRLPVF